MTNDERMLRESSLIAPEAHVREAPDEDEEEEEDENDDKEKEDDDDDDTDDGYSE